jgi:Family of unknown function (DUF5677)
VITVFIARQEPATAERFVLHKWVKSYEDACHYQQHNEQMGQEPLDAEELRQIKRGYDSVIARFGPEFAASYGWARAALTKSNPARKGGVTFGEIEKTVAAGFWTPFFRMASHSVHPTATTIFYNIASMPGREPPIFAGPSNNGLADPGHGALLSMNNVSAALMAYATELDIFPRDDVKPRQLLECLQPCMRMQVLVKAASHFASKAGEAFLRVQKQLEVEELTKAP